MHTVGRHLIAEYYGCDSEILDDLLAVRRHMLEAARIVEATVMGETFHRYEPQGVSGTVVIAESHLSIHTWPECGYTAMDIFTCGDAFSPSLAAQLLVERLESKDPEIVEFTRGPLEASVSLPQR